jgi:hypothetical protein
MRVSAPVSEVLCFVLAKAQKPILSSEPLASNYMSNMFNKDILNPCLVHPVALAINKKNEPPLFATVFVAYSHYYMFRPT